MQALAITTLLTFLTAMLGAIWTYWLTKKREREADLRKEKLERYKAFISSLSGVIEGEGSDEGQRAFAKACNDMFLFAPQSVLIALRVFQEVSRKDSNLRKEQHNHRYSALLFEIRRDLNVQPRDRRDEFQAWLWSSGVKADDSSDITIEDRSPVR